MKPSGDDDGDDDDSEGEKSNSKKDDVAEEDTVPEKAFEVIDYAKKKNGATLPNHKGNKAYENDGRGGSQILPSRDKNGNPIKYTRYDVNPKEAGKDRDGQRVIMGDDGSAWYAMVCIKIVKEFNRKNYA